MKSSLPRHRAQQLIQESEGEGEERAPGTGMVGKEGEGQGERELAARGHRQ